MTSIIITICYILGGDPVCVPVERTAPVSLAECEAREEAVELFVVRDLIGQGFPFPLESVTAECGELM